uniref:Uncharacterized protein n=1 Tax=Brassica oleracea var. oleracea TaxID=109376 RepID=A0A0D3A9W7_BRAOL
MEKMDEQHVSGELSRVEEAGTEDSTSTYTNGRTSTSTDGMTSTSTDARTSTSPDGTTSIYGSKFNTGRIPSNDTNKRSSIDAITSPSIDTGRISEKKEFDVCGNLRDGDTTTRSDKSGEKKRRNWKKRKRIIGDSQLSLISGNLECASDASQSHLQGFEHSLLLR